MGKRDDELQIGATYLDKHGVEWLVRSFLCDEGRWFIDADRGEATHVHVMRLHQRVGHRNGKFVKRAAFVKSLAVAAGSAEER